jgi:N-acetyl-alpha-D-glucosaminyl L-malate synthase BshA
MKIAIACYPTHGGSGVIASELALGLAERGHKIHIVSYAVPFRLRTFHPNVLIHEVEVASYPLFKYPPYTLGLATKLAEVATEHELDVIHAHYAVPHAVSAFLAKQILNGTSLKFITTLHGTDITLVGADESFHRVIRFAIVVSDGVTAVSKYLRQRTIDEFGIDRPVEVIYNFVNTSRCRRVTDGCTRDHWAPNGEKILMHASNFRPVKRVSDVVRIFERVNRAIPSKLLLVGQGPERLFVQQLVKELGLAKHVHFVGEEDYLESLLRCVDVFVFAPRSVDCPRWWFMMKPAFSFQWGRSSKWPTPPSGFYPMRRSSGDSAVARANWRWSVSIQPKSFLDTSSSTSRCWILDVIRASGTLALGWALARVGALCVRPAAHS